MSETQTHVDNDSANSNAAIRSARSHISNLEQQISELRISSNATAAEKEALAAQKQALESEKQALLDQIKEAESFKVRVSELEQKLNSMVEARLKEFPEDKVEQVKVMIQGMSPDRQLEHLEALKSFITSNVMSPTPGNPPPPPSSATNSIPNIEPQQETLTVMREMVKQGKDPLSALTLKVN